MARIRIPRAPLQWTPALAYAIGLITTDGNLSQDGRHIAFGSNDRILVRTLLRILHREERSRIAQTFQNGFSHRPHYRTQISDVRFYHQLLNVGLKPKKSKTLGSLHIPDYVFRDFLRGHLDGDGTVYTYTDSYNAKRWSRPQYVYTRLYLRFISASGTHIRWIAKTIKRLTGISGSATNRADKRRPNTTMWEVKYAKRDSLALLCWMYHTGDAPCLARKKAIVVRFLRNSDAHIDHRRTSWYQSNVTTLRKTLDVHS